MFLYFSYLLSFPTFFLLFLRKLILLLFALKFFLFFFHAWFQEKLKLYEISPFAHDLLVASYGPVPGLIK